MVSNVLKSKSTVKELLFTFLLLSIAGVAFADDKYELTLKREIHIERRARLDAQFRLMQITLKEIQDQYKVNEEELKDINTKLKAFDPVAPDKEVK